MSLTALAVTAAAPVSGISTPDMCSFCIQDSGSGGDLYINGRGILDASVPGAIDLATLFGSAFRSTALVQAAFRALPTVSDANALTQMVKNMAVDIVSMSTLPTAQASINGFLGSANSVNGPYLNLRGPGAAGIWRVTLQLRHSIQG